MERKHPLCRLANELRLIVEREINIFYPVLHHWYPEYGMTIAMQLHQIYGERLVSFYIELITVFLQLVDRLLLLLFFSFFFFFFFKGLVDCY